MKSPFQSPFFQNRASNNNHHHPHHRSKSPTYTPPTSSPSTPTSTTASAYPWPKSGKPSRSPSRHLFNSSTTSFVTVTTNTTVTTSSTSGKSTRSKGKIRMGQNNGKFDFEHPQQPSTFSSPGPDPFHYSPAHVHTRPAPPPPPASSSSITPEFYHAPLSAPVISTSTKARGLIRTLSAKRKGDIPVSSPAPPIFDELPPIGSLKALKTLGQVDVRVRMKIFEAFVARAEAEVEAGNHSFDSEAGTLHTKRMSVGRGLELEESTPSPVPLSATPSYLRPAPHRRTSSSSIHSSRASIKSARRAEREWRAKVAALSSGLSPVFTVTSPPRPAHRSKGPVPPRRTPNSASAAALSASQTSRSTTPPTEEGSIIITPPHSALASLGTPLSNKSFETLGHYPNSSPSPSGERLSPSLTPLASPSPLDVWEGRNRKPSVPHSAVSSMYDTLARPASYASIHLLAPSPLRVNTSNTTSALRSETTTPTNVSQHAPTPVSASSCYSTSEAGPSTPHGKDLPPFSSFQQSPRLVGCPALSGATEMSSLREGDRSKSRTSTEDTEGRLERRSGSESEVDADARNTMTTPQPTSSPRDERKHHSLPSPPRTRNSVSARPLNHIDSSYPPVLPPLASLPPLSAPCTPVHATPQRPKREYESSVPYSPTTAFILSAPSQSLDQLAWSSNYDKFSSSPEKREVQKPKSGSGYESDPGFGHVFETTKDEVPYTPIRSKHPYTIGAKPSPGAPVKSNVSAESAGISGGEIFSKSADSDSSEVRVRSVNRAELQAHASQGAASSLILPRHATSTHKDSFIPRQLPSTFQSLPNPGRSQIIGKGKGKAGPSDSANILRPKINTNNIKSTFPSGPTISTDISAAKLAVVGSSDDRATGPGIKRLTGKVNLTPGMDDGCRPPKSGLPMADLEKWLASTAM